jgi:hypothetical protein
VAFLALVLHLPMRRIQAYLRLVHQLTISTGEVVELLHFGSHVTNFVALVFNDIAFLNDL